MIKFNIHSVKFGKGPYKFNRLLKSIQYDTRISPLSRLIHLTMLESDDYKPTLERLAKQYKVSPATIDRAILELKKVGYLESSGSKENTVYDVYAVPRNVKFEVKKYHKVNNKKEVNSDDVVNLTDDAMVNLTDDALLVIQSQSQKIETEIETNLVTNSTLSGENPTTLVTINNGDLLDFDFSFGINNND